MTPFDAYAIYEAVKLHFNDESYDYFKYNGKTRTSQKTFLGRSDKIFFQILAKKYNTDEEYVRFLVANFLRDDKAWVRELAGENAHKHYLDFKRKSESLAYNFKQEIQFALERVSNPEELLKVESGQHPMLFVMYKDGDVSLETIIILDMVLGFISMWNKRINDTIIWSRTYRKIAKYRPFMSIDLEKYKKIVKDALCA